MKLATEERLIHPERETVHELWQAKQRIEELERLATQRGARMQIMRAWMRTYGHWDRFLQDREDAVDWFDEYGVPVR